MYKLLAMLIVSLSIIGFQSTPYAQEAQDDDNQVSAEQGKKDKKEATKIKKKVEEEEPECD